MDEGTFALKADGAAVTAAMILALIERVKGLDLRT